MIDILQQITALPLSNFIADASVASFDFMEWAFPSGTMEKLQNNPPSLLEVVFAMSTRMSLR